jgi:hypothetical protein
LFPTVAEITHVKVPTEHTLDGKTLTTLLTGTADANREPTFLMHYPHSPHRSNYFTCYRDGDWKVIYHYFPSKASEGSHYQLYNLAKDPFESTNLALENRGKLREMMEKLGSELDRHDARMPFDGEPIFPKTGDELAVKN